eukprot:1560842-Amphidinium_carterae.2
MSRAMLWTTVVKLQSSQTKKGTSLTVILRVRARATRGGASAGGAPMTGLRTRLARLAPPLSPETL